MPCASSRNTLEVSGNRALFGESEIESVNGTDGEIFISGTGELGGKHAFALTRGNVCSVYTADNKTAEMLFDCETSGVPEVYFTGGYVFVSPAYGDARAYSESGGLIKIFDENGYLAETEMFGGYIAAGYISSDKERYSLILGEGLETVVRVPGLSGITGAETVIIDDGYGSLHARKIYPAGELIEMAESRLDGRELTEDEVLKYNAG